jgi:3-hydroxybutyryl-CoA dehydrogenase
MSDMIAVFGPGTLGPIIQRHTSKEVQFWGNDPQQGPDPLLIIDATLGPVPIKRDRLRWVAEQYPQTLILTASSTVLLATQRRWITNPERMIGFDPWLMQIDARVLTVADDGEWRLFHREMLSQIFSGWQWQKIADQVGAVFARVIAPLVNESMAYVSMGITHEDINQAVKLGLNHPKGPLQWTEVFGISQVGLVLQAMHRGMGERFLPHPLIQRQMAEEGVNLDA